MRKAPQLDFRLAQQFICAPQATSLQSTSLTVHPLGLSSSLLPIKGNPTREKTIITAYSQQSQV
ncbi:hypothetical protein I79_000755 [Cricetulus griseus]|uniref:Uncharacterized protein n=1 Tax=Cricetulus griseus TaxID=10029 RepID=G3GSY3_CRIGR|nr:hypothetical protein I79_000755 [Cricetulus griseus]